MTTALTEQAAVGRRVEFAFLRDEPAVYHPGIITAMTDDPACLRVRIDGTRSNLAVRPDYERLRYLDTVTDVPSLPMGRFAPTARDMGYEQAGVSMVEFEDGDMVFLTTDRQIAVRGLTAHAVHTGMDTEDLNVEDLRLRWVVFEWEPEDAESPWVMTFAEEGDDQALRIYYLPAP